MGEPVFFRVSGGPVFGLPVLGRSGLFFYQSSSGPNLNSTYSQGVKLSQGREKHENFATVGVSLGQKSVKRKKWQQN